MTWTADTVASNLDFETFSGGFTGWTIVTGTPVQATGTEGGGSFAFRGGAADTITSVSQDLAIPVNGKKVRLTVWQGINEASFTNGDAACTEIKLYNIGGTQIGGVASGTRQIAQSVDQYILEAIVPSDAVTAKVFVHAIRGQNGTVNNGTVTNIDVDWWVSATPIFQSVNVLANGDFELGDSPPTGWTHISGNGLISTTSATFVDQGTYGATCNNSASQRSRQIASIVPAGVEGVYLSGVLTGSATDSRDQGSLQAVFKNSVGTVLSTKSVLGPSGNIRKCWCTIFVSPLPVGTATIEVDLFLELRDGTTVNAGADDIRLIFFDSSPIDTTTKIKLRLPSATWFTINPTFNGIGFPGWVPDPGTGTNTRILQADGTWVEPTGGSGGHVIQDEGAPVTVRPTLNFIGAGVTAADNGGTLATDVTIPGVTVTDSAHINFTLAGQDITGTIQPNSIGSAELDSTTDAALALAHVAVTVTDSAHINFTLAGQDITGTIQPNSIGFTELDAAVDTTLSTFVVGPASAVNNDIARFDGTTGKLVKAGLAYQTNVLDTAAGVLLAQDAFGLRDAYSVPGNGYTDFNEFDFSGFLVAGNTETYANSPNGFPIIATGSIFVNANTLTSYVSQIAIYETASGLICSYRAGSAASLGGSGVWTAWSEIPVGPVSVDTVTMNTNYLKSGFYTVDGTVASNTPTSALGHVLTLRSGGATVSLTQFFVVSNTGTSTSPSPMYKRTRYGNTTTWTPWHKIFDSIGQNLNTSPTGSIGFTTGAGGSITQGTDKFTGVTLDKPCGRVITHAQSLAGGAEAKFTLTNSQIGVNDCVSVSTSGPNSSYSAVVSYVQAGTCVIILKNHSGGALAEAVTINFVVVKSSVT